MRYFKARYFGARMFQTQYMGGVAGTFNDVAARCYPLVVNVGSLKVRV